MPKAALFFFFFLITPPFFLPSLIRNSLNLPFGAQGRSRRPDEVFFLQIRNGAREGVVRKHSFLGGFHRVVLCFKDGKFKQKTGMNIYIYIYSTYKGCLYCKTQQRAHFLLGQIGQFNVNTLIIQMQTLY